MKEIVVNRSGKTSHVIELNKLEKWKASEKNVVNILGMKLSWSKSLIVFTGKAE